MIVTNGATTGSERVKATGAAQCPTVDKTVPPTTKKDPGTSVKSAKMEKQALGTDGGVQSDVESGLCCGKHLSIGVLLQHENYTRFPEKKIL